MLTDGDSIDENAVYWKCEANQLLQEKLLIPVTNNARERALILAAQQVNHQLRPFAIGK
jgi:hypothetical protein